MAARALTAKEAEAVVVGQETSARGHARANTSPVAMVGCTLTRNASQSATRPRVPSRRLPATESQVDRERDHLARGRRGGLG